MIDAFKKTAEAITLHGLGFLQLQLPANQRLHIWHPELPRRRCFANSAIHNHRFSFDSLVLIGTQVNVRYAVDRYSAAKTHALYLHEGERTKYGNRPWTPDGEAFIRFQATDVVSPGQRYSMAAYDFHSTSPSGDGKVATLMTKLSEGDTGAHSTCILGITPDVDFDRKQWSEAQLWEIVREVLGVSAEAPIAAAA